MQISLPKEPKIKQQDKDRAVFEIEGCYPGYGVTLGNALRRVLLSSLPGVAVVGVKIKGVQHEFSTLPFVVEDMIEIILNLKQVRFKMVGEDRARLEIKAKGKKNVIAADIKTPGNVEIINPDQPIAVLSDKKSELEMSIEIERGLGFVPVENSQREKLEIGFIAVDAIFTPIKKVNVEVENMRVGDRTDFDRLIVDIQTDGSLEPKEAFERAAKILVEQFGVFTEARPEETPEAVVKDKKEAPVKKIKTEEDVLKTKVEDIKQLSTRTINALQNAGIKTLGGLAKKKISSLGDVEGLGDKSVKEIEKALKKSGLEIKE